jgi:hypothetical protein
MRNAMKILHLVICMMGLSALSFAQDAAAAAPPRITSADAKTYSGKTATVCGKVVDTKVPRYGLAGRGKPVTFDLDQPEPKPVFYFVAFGTKDGGPDEVVNAYKNKHVCVTGQIEAGDEHSAPFILAADRSKIKVQPEAK